MAMQMRVLRAFGGVRQDVDDFLLAPDASPDACNMQTRDGRLAVAGGFSRAVPTPLPGDVPLRQLYAYARPDGVRFLLCTDTHLWTYAPGTASWQKLCTFGAQIGTRQFDFLPVKIGTKEYLLIAHGRERILKWDGEGAPEPFGSAAQGSDREIHFLEQHFGRLYAAGDPLAPARLYWSQTPGDGRTIEDWSSADASPDVSGGFVDVGTDGDPITGLFAMSNQLLIFKRDSLWRLLGDRPSNYRILPVDAASLHPKHMACVRYADRLYFLSRDGLCFFDGQTVRRPATYRALCRLLKGCDLDRCEAAAAGDVLYFSVRERGEGNDVLIEYDVTRDTCMVRRGFTLYGLSAARGALYALTGARTVVQFDESESYDGAPIDAWWTTPRIDLGSKLHKKTLGELACTGEGGPVAVTLTVDGRTYESKLVFSEAPDGVAEDVLRGEGRVFRLRFANENGGAFAVDAGVSLRFDTQLRPE